VTTITLPSDAGTPVTPGLEATQASAIGNYFNMKLEKESLRRAQTAVRTALGSPGDTAVSVDALAAIDAVNRSPELTQALKELTDKRASLRAMRQQFTPEYAGVRKLTEDIRGLETRTIPRLARDLLVDLSQREANLDGLIAQASGDLKQIPPRAINEARLRRQVEVSTSIYTMLQQRFTEANLAAESSTPDIRILDRAVVPSAPISDRRWAVIVFGLLGGLGAGVLVGIGADRLDPRVRYPEHITQGMRLAILGAVPHVRLGRGAHEMRPALEAIRGIRLSVVHAHGVGPVVLTVSSAGPGDGKTFLSANLALAFADMQQKTLVIDGDVRRGELHRLYGGTRKPGLTDFLAGRVGLEQLIQHGQSPLLDFIGSGSRLPEGPELLASGTMRKLLLELRSRYSVILVDSPPLAAGVDAFTLATLTGNLLLVLRTGRTDRGLAEAKLDILDRLPVRVLGAILNGIDDSAGVYRYYSYSPAYAALPPGVDSEDGKES